ncbi:MAG: Peptidylprolyl isomerase [Verrucomicrobiaceae bacterium]|nr:Peptidylprolyl isomerase [Verrucomicrobiaceae bacterium]MDB6116858.1 Peptidylprolyl isomerase [Verrucomicrobiaceae bacterium]
MIQCLAIVAAGLVGFTAHLNAQEAKPAETKPATPPATAKVKITLETSKGNIELELDGGKAPVSTANFVSYAKKGQYTDSIFHRVIPGFMIQGGGFTADMVQKPTDAPIKNEASNGLTNDRGTISMARTGNPDSATCQFFINLVDNKGLDRPNPDGHGYAVFGKVVKGMDIVDAIAAAPTGVKNGMRDVPTDTISIKSAKVAE